MLIIYTGSSGGRLDDIKLEPGDELAVDSDEGNDLIASGLFELVQLSKKKKSKNNDELELEGEV